MRTNILSDGEPTSSIEAQSGQDDGTIVPTIPWFAHLVKTLWPIKGSVAVAQYAQCPDRTARAYASGDREPPASVLRDHLRGDEGYRVLKHVMAGSTATWWIVIQHERDVYARLQELSPSLRGILDAVMK